MFTQCPECGSVFRVTADALKVAGGLVRCGVCQHGFDALAALTDDPGAPPAADSGPAPADETGPPAFDDTITVEELGSGEVIELGAANDDEVDGEEAAALAPSIATDAETRTEAEEWLPETVFATPDNASVPVDPEDAIAEVDAAPDQDAASAADDFEVNDSSVTGLEAIVLMGDDLHGADDASSATEANDAEPGAESTDTEAPREDVASADAIRTEPDAIPGDDLEFHGSEEDLERVFIATGAPVLAGFDPAPPPHTPEDLPAATAVDELTIDEALAALGPPDEPEPAVAAHGATIDVDGAPVANPPEPDAIAAEYSVETSAADNASDDAETAPENRPDLDRTDEFPILVLDEQDEPLTDGDGIGDKAAEPESAADDPLPVEPDSGNDSSADASRTAVAGLAAVPLLDPRHAAATVEPATDAPVATSPRFAIPAELRRRAAAAEATDDTDLQFGLEDDSPRWWERRAIWSVGSALLALTLIAQAVHYNRESLARDAALGPWVLRTYGLLGLPAPVPSDLAAIELHQWGAATDAHAAGRLRLRASLVNRAPFAQPYPVLRVTLHDRFGNVLGSRDVGARDYLPGDGTQRRLLATGQRLDAEVVVVDPGAEAVGYEIDLCEELRDGVRCQGAARSAT